MVFCLLLKVNWCQMAVGEHGIAAWIHLVHQPGREMTRVEAYARADPIQSQDKVAKFGCTAHEC